MLTQSSSRVLGLFASAIFLAACSSAGTDVDSSSTPAVDVADDEPDASDGNALPSASDETDTRVSEQILAERSDVQAALRSQGFQPVPSGLVHASCVHSLEEGDTLGDDGSIRRANGTVETFAPCAYPRYTSDGVKIDAKAMGGSDLDHTESLSPELEKPSTAPVLDFPIPGWRESTEWISPVNVGNYTQQFHVPAAPHLVLGQLIYLFPALQGNGTHGILQPVLQFGESSDGKGGDYWSIASWVGGDPWQGHYYASPHLRVTPGEVITGGMNIAKNDCTSAGCRWDVRAAESTHGGHTGISVHTIVGWREVFGGVLEIYNVRYCSQYPATYDNFYNFDIHGMNNVHYTPNWAQHYNPHGQSTFCGEKITSNSTITNLYWTQSVRP